MIKMRYLLAIVVFGLALAFVAAPESEAKIANGDGTKEHPYQIGTAEELKEFRDMVNNHKGAYCRLYADLTADITLNDIRVTKAYANQKPDLVDSNGNEVTKVEEWTPIGNDSVIYSGRFNGNRHQIRGLYVYQPDSDFAGLFGYSSSATIRDVYLTDSFVCGHNFCGGIVGMGVNTMLITCVNGIRTDNTKWSYVVGNRVVGGIAGYLIDVFTEDGKDINGYHFLTQGIKLLYTCVNGAVVYGYNEVGGVIGSAHYFEHDGGSQNRGVVQATKQDNPKKGEIFGEEEKRDQGNNNSTNAAKRRKKSEIKVPIEDAILPLQDMTSSKDIKKSRSQILQDVKKKLSKLKPTGNEVVVEEKIQVKSNETASVINEEEGGGTRLLFLGGGAGVVILVLALVFLIKKRKKV